MSLGLDIHSSENGEKNENNLDRCLVSQWSDTEGSMTGPRLWRRVDSSFRPSNWIVSHTFSGTSVVEVDQPFFTTRSLRPSKDNYIYYLTSKRKGLEKKKEREGGGGEEERPKFFPRSWNIKILYKRMCTVTRKIILDGLSDTRLGT